MQYFLGCLSSYRVGVDIKWSTCESEANGLQLFLPGCVLDHDVLGPELNPLRLFLFNDWQ